MTHKDYILYLEDDEIDAIKFTSTLKNLNFNEEIIVQRNGQAGLEWLEDNSNWLPKIIVLDLNMPVMDGMTFLGKIKNDVDLHKIPIIVLTQSESKTDIESSFEHQVAGYMVKPFEDEDYVAIIKLIKDYWNSSVVGHQ